MNVHNRLKPLILFCLIFPIASVYSQKNELKVRFYSGHFSYYGPGSSRNSTAYFFSPGVPQNQIEKPFGRKPEFSYSVGFKFQRITPSNLIIGLGLSFESLHSKVNIDTVEGGDIYYFKEAAKGYAKLNNSFITLSPFAGKRFHSGKYSMDLNVGADVAYCVKSVQNVDVQSKLVFNDPYSYQTFSHASKIDFRPRVDVDLNYKSLSLLVGYSLGLTNYQSHSYPPAYCEFLRIGIGYKLAKRKQRIVYKDGVLMP